MIPFDCALSILFLFRNYTSLKCNLNWLMLKFLLSLRFNTIYFIFRHQHLMKDEFPKLSQAVWNRAMEIIYSTLYALKYMLKFDEREQRKSKKSIQLEFVYDFQLSAASCDSQISCRNDMTNIELQSRNGKWWTKILYRSEWNRSWKRRQTFIEERRHSPYIMAFIFVLL